ncbi:MAG: CPBP family intramembrane glutamic endopeptidase [Polyangiaceae bacterium]|jgi:membrane protease YdiL (CAAX protease family)
MRAIVPFALVVTAVSSYLAFSVDPSKRVLFWLLSAGPSAALGAVAAGWAWREELLGEWLRPRAGDFTRGLAGALLLFFVAWAFARVFLPVGSAREIWLVSLYSRIGDPRGLQSHGPLVAVVIGTSAAGEELLWRGVVTHVLAARVGSRAAWVWSSSLYAIAYWPTLLALKGGGSFNPLIALLAVGGGFLWGAMARVFGRLVPGILAHALFDWAVVMMLPLWGTVWQR